MTVFKTPLLAACILGSLAGAAYANDRKPTQEERTKIEAALKAEGYSAWSDIELDKKNGWEVDNARHEDGNVYDLKLSTENFTVTERKRD